MCRSPRRPQCSSVSTKASTEGHDGGRRTVMSYSVLMDIASQREREIAARARLVRHASVPATPTPRGVKRERARVAAYLRVLAGRA